MYHFFKENFVSLPGIVVKSEMLSIIRENHDLVMFENMFFGGQYLVKELPLESECLRSNPGSPTTGSLSPGKGFNVMVSIRGIKRAAGS